MKPASLCMGRIVQKSKFSDTFFGGTQCYLCTRLAQTPEDEDLATLDPEKMRTGDNSCAKFTQKPRGELR